MHRLSGGALLGVAIRVARCQLAWRGPQLSKIASVELRLGWLLTVMGPDSTVRSVVVTVLVNAIVAWIN